MRTESLIPVYSYCVFSPQGNGCRCSEKQTSTYLLKQTPSCFHIQWKCAAKYSEKNITVVIFDYILGEEGFHDGRNSPEKCSQGRDGDRYGNVFIDKRIEWR